jgi:catechol 2,3-dioxygenase-like lactoylglutathione lyase family enzyme
MSATRACNSTTTAMMGQKHSLLQRVDHICLVVTDIDRSIAWYAGVLGFEHVLQDDPFYGKDPAFLRFAPASESRGTDAASQGVESSESTVGDIESAAGSVADADERSNLGEPICLALLPLPKAQWHSRVKNHNGAHVAFRVSRDEFERSRAELPMTLARHRLAHDTHDTSMQVFDYGRQLSLFFSDPDNNVLELTTWIDPNAKQGRL